VSRELDLIRKIIIEGNQGGCKVPVI